MTKNSDPTRPGQQAHPTGSHASDARAKKHAAEASITVHSVEDPETALQRLYMFNEWLYDDTRLTTEDAKAHNVAWWDATLRARDWCAMPRIEPADAAMLLCRYNPASRDDVAGWLDSSTLELTAEDHKIVAAWCRLVGGTHSLIEWHRMATESEVRVHPWLNGYLKSGGDCQPIEVTTGAPDKAASTPVAASDQNKPATTTVEETIAFKRAAIVKIYRDRWPTIENDLKNASRNGLQAAKLGERGWDERKMLQWAHANGRLLDIAPTGSFRAPASPMPTLDTLPRRQHSMDK